VNTGFMVSDLGMLLDRRINPKIAEEHARCGLTWLHRAGFLSLPRFTI